MKSNYVKTLLYAYPNIPKMIKRIDEIVNKKALSSMTNCTDCREQCESIIKLTVQKGILFEIKYYIEKILARFDREELIYIEYKYFGKKDKAEFEGVDFAGRAYFRKQQKLLEHICNCFEWLKISDEWFEGSLKKVPYLRKLLQSVLLHQNASASGTRKVKPKTEEVALKLA